MYTIIASVMAIVLGAQGEALCGGDNQPQCAEVTFKSKEAFDTRRQCERTMFVKNFELYRQLKQDYPDKNFVVVTKCQEVGEPA